MPRSQGTSRKGKPKKHERAAGMGRALIKAQPNKHKSKSSMGGMAMRAGVDSINVHEDDQRISVLEMNDLDDFLVQAEMANREFESEREQLVVIDETTRAVPEIMERPKAIAWSDQPDAIKDPFAFQELSVPRRPAWNEGTTPAELDALEKDTFLEWRRQIAQNEEKITSRNLGVTPFEKNIEMWRQLWRVMERCSCIVQIVDARNPLFYLSKDLKAYATQELKKPMLLLINKSDFLTASQRQAWHEFFSDPENAWDHVFFSAHIEQKILDDQPPIGTVEEEPELLPQVSDDSEDDEDDDDDEDQETDENDAKAALSESKLEEKEPIQNVVHSLEDVGIEQPLSREGLLGWLHEYAVRHNCPTDKQHDRIPFGMVGFPNVGKSSVINVLMGNAKHTHGVVRVGVAAQPGKTKHFQTLLLPSRDDMLLCDCPGLVFPSFVNNTADLIAAGVYPIAQMRDPWPVLNLLCQRIPREVLDAQYGIHIPLPSADEMLKYGKKGGKIPPPTAEEFLTTYCVARGLLAASSGVPDHTKASRIVIKDYAVGKLLYCHPPPRYVDREGFFKATLKHALQKTQRLRDKIAFEDDEVDQETDSAADGDVDEDDMLLDMLDETATSSSSGQKPARTKKWGKKGRKLRNKDPYGCHSNPDDGLSEAGGGAPAGVVVKGGKHGKKGYTRPIGYAGTRSLS